MKNKMPSKLYQPLSTHLTIWSLHRGVEKHWGDRHSATESQPATPILTCICYLNVFLNRLLENQTKMSKSFCWTCSPQASPLSLQDSSLWMHLPKHHGHWSHGEDEVLAVPQEPPALPRDGGWDEDMLPLCARGQDTCLAPTCSSFGSKTTPFLQHQRDWSCEMERCRGSNG